MRDAVAQPLYECPDGLGLVPFRLERTDEFEAFHSLPPCLHCVTGAPCRFPLVRRFPALGTLGRLAQFAGRTNADVRNPRDGAQHLGGAFRPTPVRAFEDEVEIAFTILTE